MRLRRPAAAVARLGAEAENESRRPSPALMPPISGSTSVVEHGAAEPRRDDLGDRRVALPRRSRGRVPPARSGGRDRPPRAAPRPGRRARSARARRGRWAPRGRARRGSGGAAREPRSRRSRWRGRGARHRGRARRRASSAAGFRVMKLSGPTSSGRPRKRDGPELAADDPVELDEADLVVGGESQRRGEPGDAPADDDDAPPHRASRHGAAASCTRRASIPAMRASSFSEAVRAKRRPSRSAAAAASMSRS